MGLMLYLFIIFNTVALSYSQNWEQDLLVNFIHNDSYTYATQRASEIGGYYFQRVGKELIITKCGVYGKSPVPEVVTKIAIENLSLNSKTGFFETNIDGYDALVVIGDLHLFILRKENEKLPPFMDDLEYNKYRNDLSFINSKEKKEWYYRGLEAPRLSDEVSPSVKTIFKKK
jgi:hypothetical protein